MERQILHVDVNNAFLSWSALERLEKGETQDIREIPAIIGGDETQRHGVVLAKSMLAKQFGIKTGEPIFLARRKCPSIQVFQGDFQVYRKYSEQLYMLLLQYTDRIQRFSIDECFLDMTLFLPKRKLLIEIAKEISLRVKKELGFTVNIGVAHNKLLAKMASDFEKPDKVHTLFENEIEKKMWTLPVSDLFMVGKKTLPKLVKMKITTIGDLAREEKKVLINKFGKHGLIMWEYANGIDRSEVEYKKEIPKGIGNSITLAEDVANLDRLNAILLTLTDQVCYRLRKEKLFTCVVNVQIKTSEFQVYSHQKKLGQPTDSTKQIYRVAKQLLGSLHNGRKIRLLGIRLDSLVEKEERQLSLFELETDTKQEQLDRVIDKLRDKYGTYIVTRAGKMRLQDTIHFKE